MINLILFFIFLLILIRCAGYSIKYSSRLARTLNLPEFVVSFFIIAFISVLPETIISIISAIEGEPELGLGTLLGANIADLTLSFGIVTLCSLRGIKVRSKILKNKFFYLILLLIPLILGFDGKFSRIDGGILVLFGIAFYIKTYRDSKKVKEILNHHKKEHILKSLILLLISFGILLLSAVYTVKYAVNFANDLKLPAVLIGLTILAVGTCLPELVFSIKAVKKNKDELALGDILGTVISNTTIVLGIVALISPFTYNPMNIYLTGTAMFLAGIFVIFFMNSNKSLNKLEGLLLIIFYIIFVVLSIFINKLL
jgi:cation:H+ antiporter